MKSPRSRQVYPDNQELAACTAAPKTTEISSCNLQPPIRNWRPCVVFFFWLWGFDERRRTADLRTLLLYHIVRWNGNSPVQPPRTRRGGRRREVPSYTLDSQGRVQVRTRTAIIPRSVNPPAQPASPAKLWEKILSPFRRAIS